MRRSVLGAMIVLMMSQVAGTAQPQQFDLDVYQWIKRELARLLGLVPDDLHPLDFKSKRKLPPDDPRWRRAMWLSTLKGKEVHIVAGVRVKYRDGSLVD